MEEYKGNSHKLKEEAKKVEKVVAGTAKVKKKNDVQKFADVFIAEDIHNVKTYIFLDVLIPAIKKALYDIGTNGLDMILYGGDGVRKKSSVSKVSYGKCYDRENNRKADYRSSRNAYNYDDIIFETRGDAEAVLDAMNDIISQYGVVSVADLYDLAEVSNDNYAANKYGWRDIGGCKTTRINDGYILKLPRALPID